MTSGPVPRQLLLELPLSPQFGLDDFLVGASNEVAFGLIRRWPDWHGSMALIVGPPGSGKSHLASIWANASGATTVSTADLATAGPEALAANRALVIEDMDASPLPEAPLFHLLNLLREAGTPLLMTARRQPGQWGVATPDLLSRLRLAPVAEISAPDDAMLRALMAKLFVDRQIIVDPDVVDYVLARIERSFAAVSGAVDALDKEALALSRRITRPVAARVIDRLIPTDD